MIYKHILYRDLGPSKLVERAKTLYAGVMLLKIIILINSTEIIVQ